MYSTPDTYYSYDSHARESDNQLAAGYPLRQPEQQAQAQVQPQLLPQQLQSTQQQPQYMPMHTSLIPDRPTLSGGPGAPPTSHNRPTPSQTGSNAYHQDSLVLESGNLAAKRSHRLMCSQRQKLTSDGEEPCQGWATTRVQELLKQWTYVEDSDLSQVG